MPSMFMSHFYHPRFPWTYPYNHQHLPPPTTWVHVTHLDLLGAFHFGFPRPWLYSCIPTMSCHGVQKTCFPLNKLVQNPMNVATWHLFLLFLQRRLILSP